MSLFRKLPYTLIMFFSSCFGKGEITSKPPISTMNTVQGSIYDFKVKSIDGKEIDFAQYKGKKLLIVNTASECGFTPQYEDLQKLHVAHGDKVVILGFPCNDFGGQEPGTAKDIQAFCQKNYGVTFQLFEKVHVKGDGVAPIYQWLSDKKKNGWNDKAPGWNFGKYLINEKGELVKFYSSTTNPMSKDLLEAISAK